jgi:hypothetical protein
MLVQVAGAKQPTIDYRMQRKRCITNAFYVGLQVVLVVVVVVVVNGW